ncbi:hypothetical protein GOEFS_037_00090 [Gordonia effusa NBRC 100432]|uniref:DUF2771 domain-containing protein n=1 Tax=Gordonia effusa NBRC 100432 TaxID=1077974 RepID=H0QY05_9ACTN|nr:DUF2771 family protein [Gordonia effusa]GAB17706.1 hypothetical protein GOEFS_037_00090 [Gordonia effusa NBRC 100432]
MNFTAAEKKTLAILAAIALLFGAIVVGGAASLAHNTESDHRPYMQIAVGDELTRVYPIVWCDVLMRECDPPLRSKSTRTKSHVPVNVGQTALVSVSAEIADSPWALIAEYYTPRGITRDEPVYRSGTQYTVALHSTLDRTLINVEIQAPSAVNTDQGFVVRGFLAADTTPKRETAEQ